MNQLKQMRKKQNLNQQEIAQKMGVTLSYYQKVEQGTRMAGSGFVTKFISAFPETSTDVLFIGGDKK